MSSNGGYQPASRKGRMNRSRIIAAGTSVGALVAITAGVAAANPAPSATHAARNAGRTATSDERQPALGDGSALDGTHDDWQQLPADPSVSDPGFGNSSVQPPAFDPGSGQNNLGGSDTRSGGS